MVYVLHLDGATSNDLDKYKTVALNAFSCCKDYPHLDISVGCYDLGNYYCQASPSSPYGPDTECYWKGWIRVKRVVVTGPITVWVTRLGLGIATVPNNTLLGDTHDKIGCQQHP